MQQISRTHCAKKILSCHVAKQGTGHSSQHRGSKPKRGQNEKAAAAMSGACGSTRWEKQGTPVTNTGEGMSSKGGHRWGVPHQINARVWQLAAPGSESKRGENIVGKSGQACALVVDRLTPSTKGVPDVNEVAYLLVSDKEGAGRASSDGGRGGCSTVAGRGDLAGITAKIVKPAGRGPVRAAKQGELPLRGGGPCLDKRTSLAKTKGNSLFLGGKRNGEGENEHFAAGTQQRPASSVLGKNCGG